MKVQDISIDKIEIPDNRLGYNRKRVNALVDSISLIGLQHPIGITKSYNLIHGRNRIAAYVELERNTIPAIIHDLDSMLAEIAEIDENLQRNSMTALERAAAMKRRKAIYETLFPQTKHGGAKGAGRGKAKAPKETKVDSFVSNTAKQTGKSATSIKRDVSLAANIDESVQETIKGHPIANNKSQLKKLGQLEPEKQKEIAAQLVSGEIDRIEEPEPEAGGFDEQSMEEFLDDSLLDYAETLFNDCEEATYGDIAERMEIVAGKLRKKKQ